MTTPGKVRSPFLRQMVVNGLGLRRIRQSRQGFTYIESMIALAVLSLSAVALLNSVAGAISASNDSVYRTIGKGLAEQLLDEIAAAKFPSGTATTPPTVPFRSSFSTIDDYAGWTESPPRTKAGEVLGADNGATATEAYMSMMTGSTSRAAELQAAPGFVNRFTRSVLVERVQPGSTDWTVQTQHTPHRRVTVSVTYTASNQPARMVGQASRVFSSVAPSP